MERWPVDFSRSLWPSEIFEAGPSDSAARRLPRSCPHCSLWSIDKTSYDHAAAPSNGMLISHNKIVVNVLYLYICMYSVCVNVIVN